MFRSFLVLLYFFLSTPYFLYSQSTYRISGRVSAKDNKEALSYTNISLLKGNTGTLSDSLGNFSLLVEEGEQRIVFVSLGAISDTLSIFVRKDTTINVQLKKDMHMNEVVIESNRAEQLINSLQMSSSTISAREAQILPQIVGEQNIIRVLQLKPGVQSASEGSAGFYVRGGTPGQNLIFLDKGIVYNPNHLLGFFSVFNPDVIDNAEIFKGSFPANVGGRISSVLNVRMKKPSDQKLKVSGGLGIVGSRICVEGPIKKNKSSVLLAARSSYFNYLSNKYNERNAEKSNFHPIPDYSFYDLNFKSHTAISTKDEIIINAFTGTDQLKFKENHYNFKIRWQNSMSHITWNRRVSKKLNASTSISFSKYTYDLNNTINIIDVNLKSNIMSKSIETQWEYNMDSTQKITFGAAYNNYKLGVGNYTSGYTDGRVTFSTGKNLAGAEFTSYIHDDITINPRLRLGIGSRFSLMRNGSTIYFNPEPRLAARYKYSTMGAFKIGYSRMVQNIHLITTSGASLPTDLWRLSNNQIKPQKGDHYNLGMEYLLNKKSLYINIEIYYKNLHNQIDMQNASDVLISDNVDKDFYIGKGSSYGTELYIEKKEGNFKGWISYTLGWSWLQIPEINDGKKYPSRFDRRHDVSVVGYYSFFKRWDFSATWVFGTGNAITLPVSRYAIQDVYGTQFKIVPEYTNRNSFRMPAYHRMDVGITYHIPVKKSELNINLSVYNVYNRRNTYFMYFSAETDGKGNVVKFKPEKVSLFPAIPSISINFKY